jgi:hypothetical protein
MGDRKNLDFGERSEQLLWVGPEKAEGAPRAERRNFARSRAKKRWEEERETESTVIPTDCRTKHRIQERMA